MVIGINKEILISGTATTGFLQGGMFETADDSIIFATYSQGLAGKNNGGIITFEGVGEIGAISNTVGIDNFYELTINMQISNKTESSIVLFSQTFNYADFGSTVPFSFKGTIGVGFYAVDSLDFPNVTSEVYFHGNKNLILNTQLNSGITKANSGENRIINFSFKYNKPANIPDVRLPQIMINRVIAEFKEIGS